MRQKIFFLKGFDSELLYVQGPILKKLQRFSLTLSVSTNNLKCLDFFRTGPSQIAMIRSTSFYFYTISETQGLNRMDMENTGFPILAGRGETDTQFQVSKQNSILDLIDPYRILWKAVFDESRMYGLGGDLSFISFEIHPTIWGQKAKINDFSPYKNKTDS